MKKAICFIPVVLLSFLLVACQKSEPIPTARFAAPFQIEARLSYGERSYPVTLSVSEAGAVDLVFSDRSSPLYGLTLHADTEKVSASLYGIEWENREIVTVTEIIRRAFVLAADKSLSPKTSGSELHFEFSDDAGAYLMSFDSKSREPLFLKATGNGSCVTLFFAEA